MINLITTETDKQIAPDHYVTRAENGKPLTEILRNAFWIDNGNCYKCNFEGRILCADNSSDEYTPCEICQNCINKGFQEDLT